MSKIKAVAAQTSGMTLVLNKDLACPKCLGPGTFKSDALTRDGYNDAQIFEFELNNPNRLDKIPYLRRGWPELWVPLNDPRVGRPVGDTCPACGSGRSAKQKPIKNFTLRSIFR